MSSGAYSASDVVEGLEDVCFAVESIAAEALERMVKLCAQYDVAPAEAASDLLAFVINKDQISPDQESEGELKADEVVIDLKLLNLFESSVLKPRESTTDKENAGLNIVRAKDLASATDNDYDDFNEDDEDGDDLLNAYGAGTNTPAGKKRPQKRALAASPSVAFSPGTPSGKYKTRRQAGATILKFGPEVAAQDWTSPLPTFDAGVALPGKDSELRGLEKRWKDHRYMFQALVDKSNFLDSVIWEVGQRIAEKHRLDEDDAIGVNLAQPLTNTATVVGRIRCDAAEGRLNAHSLLLEGAKRVSGGRSVSLDVSRLDEYSLFPGQVVACRAMNPSGQRLFVEQLCADASLPPPAPADRIKDEAMNVVIASGPFSPADNLDYQPLRDILDHVRKRRPHVVILIGPFVDARNELVEKCAVDRSFSEIFDGVMRIVSDALDDLPHTKVLVVSSQSDVHHKPVYPTPPFKSPEREGLVMLPDPCLIRLEGVTFGLTATDILMHLSKEEISFTSQSRPADRMRRLVTHLLQQRSFYPLHPANEDVNMDLEHFLAHGMFEEQPQVMVLPSALMHFFKDVNGSLVVNPGHITKGESGGVFAQLRISPRSAEEQTFVQRCSGLINKI